MCDEGVRVTVSGASERLLVAVKGAASIRFWTATDDLEEAIESRTPLQLSVHGGFCRLEVRGDRVYLDFAEGGSGRKSCDFPLRDLQEAIEMVRRQRPVDMDLTDLLLEP